MISQANLQTLAKGGGKYLLAMPMRRGDEITEEVLSRPGRYRTVAENLEVKEVIVGEGVAEDGQHGGHRHEQCIEGIHQSQRGVAARANEPAVR